MGKGLRCPFPAAYVAIVVGTAVVPLLCRYVAAGDTDTIAVIGTTPRTATTTGCSHIGQTISQAL